MSRTLKVPNEYRFVQALALTVGPGDSLGLLLEVGALRGEDQGVVRRVKEVLWPGAYDVVSTAKAWDLVHAVTVLTNALEGADAQGYLAYQAARLGFTPEMVMETLARVGVAQEWHGRPWSDDLGEYRLGQWREWVVQLLALAGAEMLGLPAPRVERAGQIVIGEYLALVEG